MPVKNQYHVGWRESRERDITQLSGHLALLQMFKDMITKTIREKQAKKIKIKKELDDQKINIGMR